MLYRFGQLHDSEQCNYIVFFIFRNFAMEKYIFSRYYICVSKFEMPGVERMKNHNEIPT